MTSWRPILPEETAEQAHLAVLAIGDELRDRSDRFDEAGDPEKLPGQWGLAAGWAGIAVCLARFEEVFPRRGYGEAAWRVVVHLESWLQEGGAAADGSLFTGYPGIAWAANDVRRRLGSRPAIDWPEVIDEQIDDDLDWGSPGQPFDLVTGKVGVGVYCLTRLPGELPKRCLETIVVALERRARRSGAGASWHTSPEMLPAFRREEFPSGFQDLGPAHGAAGVIAFLGAVLDAGISREVTAALLEDAVRWILAQRMEELGCWAFPTRIVEGKSALPARNAWCYGNPGMAMALSIAGESARRPDWVRSAHEMAASAAERPLEETGVVDAGLCHGAVGQGHMYQRLYASTGDERFLRAARAWVAHALSLRTPESSSGGFRAIRVDASGSRFHADEAGLVEGSAGIGLALLAAFHAGDPDWDGVFLMSAPAHEKAPAHSIPTASGGGEWTV